MYLYLLDCVKWVRGFPSYLSNPLNLWSESQRFFSWSCWILSIFFLLVSMIPRGRHLALACKHIKSTSAHAYMSRNISILFLDAIQNKLGIKATQVKWKLYVLVVDDLPQPFTYCLEVEESCVQSILLYFFCGGICIMNYSSEPGLVLYDTKIHYYSGTILAW